jgi:hypothetical protein
VKCDICQDSKRVRLVRHQLQCAPTPAEEMVDVGHAYREFDCPQCVPTVPYQKVRALKLITEYDVEQARRFQEPIKRSLAAAFGQYLLRNGLINFTSDDSDRSMSGRTKIVAEMGAVTLANAEKAAALVEAVETDPPQLSAKLQQRARANAALREKLEVMEPWMGAGIPQPEPVRFRASKSTAEKVRDVRESREGARDRFSGLELFQDNGEFQ